MLTPFPPSHLLVLESMLKTMKVGPSFASLCMNKRFSDITIETQDGVLHAHKCILFARWASIRTMVCTHYPLAAPSHPTTLTSFPPPSPHSKRE